MAKKSAPVRKFPAPPLEAGNVDDWLKQICQYVETEAEEAITWYFDRARGKKRGSQITRYLAIFFGGVAGVLPLLAQVWPPGWPSFALTADQVSLLPSLMLGMVAVALAVDRFSDFSSGWIRYMLTAFDIRAGLQEFRMDWACQYSQLPQPPKLEDVCKSIEIAKAFVIRVEKQVGEETKQWAKEFQQNLAGMERDVTDKLALKEQKTSPESPPGQ